MPPQPQKPPPRSGKPAPVPSRPARPPVKPPTGPSGKAAVPKFQPSPALQRKMPGALQREYTAHDLMRDILEMTTKRWVDPDAFHQIANKIGISNTPQRIFFLTELKEKIRLIPFKLFPAADIRQKILDSLQQALDSEISKEESL